MKTVITKYGVLKDLSYVSLYPEGGIKECILTEANYLDTSYGVLIPQYRDDDERRKRIKPLSFYENGSLKSISLQNPVEIETPVGMFSAEFISFYECGGINRVFPLDGMLSGYWTEEDEYDLATEYIFDFSFGKFKRKIIGIHFYENGGLKSITFWPKDIVVIQSPVGMAEVRIGISLYPDGRIKSLEPAKPMSVVTPIGEITAYDRKALGIHGDINSLKFTQNGVVESVVTSASIIRVTDKNGKNYIYKPGFGPNMFNPEASELIPLSIQFNDNKVRFNDSPEDEYFLEECFFSVESMFSQTKGSCSTCSGCSGCG